MQFTRMVFGLAVWAFLFPMLQARASQIITAAQAVSAVSKRNDTSDPIRLVTTLTERFGPRLTGSAPQHAAAAWAADQMKRARLSHVHAETSTLPEGCQRLHAEAHLLNPEQIELPVASYGWSGSTYGPVTGELVLVDGNAQMTAQSTQGWTGKVVLVAPASKDGIRAVADAPALANWAEKVHALAVIDGISRPGADLLHTGPIGFPMHESLVPVLDMPLAQRQRLERLARHGHADPVPGYR